MSTVAEGKNRTPGEMLDEALREARKVASEVGDAVLSGEAFHGVPGGDASTPGGDARQADRPTGRPAGTSGAGSAGGRSAAVEPELSRSERQYAVWIHAAAGLAWVLTIFTVGATFIAPLIVTIVMWQSRRHDSQYLDDHGREATNFQISQYVLVLATCGLGILVVPVLAVVGGVLAVRAANRGEYVRYPVTFRFLRPPRAERGVS
ncbi:MAG: DUF4870 domain-containing protein [Planctomycetota bacterium]